MRQRYTQQGSPPPITTRSGGTLTEVLISLLAMGVGVVTVASMFPISVMRSIQSTQLTNATLLRYNAEALVDIDRNIVLDPDGDNNLDEHNGENYIVDPLGYYLVPAAIQGQFGNGGALSRVRYHGGFSVARYGVAPAPELAARSAVVLPDSWVLKYEDSAKSATGTSVTLALISGSDAGQISTSATSPSRVILSDIGNKKSVVRTITSADADGGSLRVHWANNFSGFTIGQVRIETKETRYNHIYSVRHNTRTNSTDPYTANINVVVFFRRTFSQLDEQVYSINDGANNVKHRRGNPVLNIEYDSSIPPLVKKGNYMFDIGNVRWHRIQKIEEVSSTEVKLTLESPPQPLEQIQHVMFPRGIVDVYPIEPKSIVP